MTVFRAAAVQMRGGLDRAANVADAVAMIRDAAGRGARYVLTPEVTTVVDLKRERLVGEIDREDDNRSLETFRALAAELGVTIHVGSMAVLLPGDRIANRAYVIDGGGTLLAAYDKLHMFDVDLGGGESYRESRLFAAGDTAVTVAIAEATIGVSICYDLRFPHLYRALAKAGANVLAVPAAFTRTTGEAHWRVLVRARAIENGAFVIAAAQGGRHEDGRETWGHSMIVDPWGKVLAETGDEPGLVAADIDIAVAGAARKRIPALGHDRDFDVRRLPAEERAREAVG